MNTAILDICPAALPGADPRSSATSDIVRLFALDRLPVRRQLVCHWQRDAHCCLAATWEPDIGPELQR